MLGVESMAMNKVRFGAQFGKEVPEALWPSAFIPDRLFYDGGKLDQHNTSGIVAMGVDAQTGIPYTPELRAIIEVLNRKIKQKLKEHLGNTHKEDFDDEKAQALVDRRTYTRIIIEVILEYNQEPIEGYHLTPDMQQKEVPPVPIKLWEYGKDNCGRPRQIDMRVVHFNLLPSKRAKVLSTHLEFQGLSYVYQASEEDKQQFYGKALLKKRLYYWVDVKYNLGLVDSIYLYNGRNLVGVCQLADKDKQYAGCSWKEVEEQFKKDALVIDKYQRDRDASQQHANTHANIQSDLDRARAEVQQAQQGKQRNAAPVKGREQRATEAHAITKASALRPEDIGAASPEKQIPSTNARTQDQDVTMPETVSNVKRKLPRSVEQALKGNRPRRRQN